jgi:IBR domain.
VNYLISKIDERAFPIRCPALNCHNEISQDFTKDCLGNEKNSHYQQKLEDFAFKSFVEKQGDKYSCCLTADCPFVFEYDGTFVNFQCPKCTKMYCLRCRVEWHDGLTCKQFQEQKDHQKDEYILNFIRGQKFKQCPQCKYWVERSQGCDAMTCRCGAQFCYRCGRMGDGHKPCNTH